MASKAFGVVRFKNYFSNVLSIKSQIVYSYFMLPHEKFLQKEYQKLWQFYGVDDFKLKQKTKPRPVITSTIEKEELIYGEGSAQAKLFFVGESAEQEEHKLLTKIIEAMKLKREDVYVANISKNSNEAKITPLLKERILSIQPKIVIALGSMTTAILTQSKTGISALRGRFHPLPWDKNIFVMPTFHPAYLLKNPAAKSLVWEDMKIILNKLKSL